MNPIKILVLCTGNSCRSQMAEGWFRFLMKERAEVYSAGTAPHTIHPLAVRAMTEKGIEIAGQSSNHVNEYLPMTFDYVITVCDNAAENCPIFPGETTRLHWPFDDPAGATGTDDEKMALFRRVRDEIEAKIRAWLQGLS